ncbi:Patatin [Ectothiorhodospira sp. PHS-1]|uniref:patatin-like phospholipase family protein n=1 Tax=Ectothiorhodospira sp. PHS-1 TaxID=519989 RepID=UPI00024A8660|nr:patatin-like phospholipase family protein [Ectothiorhodospira sp. PHS-1]EHQ52877.1 Patatin [Ectothiorhodospira sp. PHS-1]
MTALDPGRRRALKALMVAALVPALAGLPGPAAAGRTPRVGLALGSGGARGLSHVLIFEVLEELGVVPHRIAGSSIGAIMGALYAAGLSSRDIHDAIDTLTVAHDESWFDSLLNREWTRWIKFLEPFGAKGGLMKSDAFIKFLKDTAGVSRFEELQIPLQVVATDFWERRMAIFDSGDLWPAVQGSMAMPGLFSPVTVGDRVLVDGGLTNPVPYDLLLEDCDITIAVDVLGTREPNNGNGGVNGAGNGNPSYFDNSFNTFQIMQFSILEEKLRRVRPDILIRPKISNVRVLEFYRFETIFEQSRPAAEQLHKELKALLGKH